MKKFISLLFMLGIVILCSFCTPIFIKYGNQIIFSNIFSARGEIVISRLLLYFMLWAALCLGLYYQFKDLHIKITIFKRINGKLKQLKLFFQKMDFKYDLFNTKESIYYKRDYKNKQKTNHKLNPTFKEYKQYQLEKKVNVLLEERAKPR